MGFLEGKTAIITGVGKNDLEDGRCGAIGYSVAAAYAKEGANLVLTGRNVKKLQEAKETLEKQYDRKVLAFRGDVVAGLDNERMVEHIIKQTVDTFGGIHVLIHNAQTFVSDVPLAEHTAEQFNLAMYSCLYAAFYYMKACYPYLAETKGSVINFISGAARMGGFGQSALAAAKEGICGLSRAAAAEWAKDGINVNMVCPMTWFSQAEQLEKAYPKMYGKTGKTISEEDYADAQKRIGRICVQLASPAFKEMSGEILTLESVMGRMQ